MTTKELIEKYNIRANKSLGQNFLHRDDIIENIARAATDCENVLEIGAGLGVLSKRLCSNYKKVATIEIDRSLKAVTDETLFGITNHNLIYADFLKFDLDDLSPYFGDGTLAAVGNLPYNITGEIVTKLLKNHSRFKTAVIMVQKEVAEKFMSRPGSKAYRAITVLTQYFCDITPLFDVSPDCFIPAPNVISTVLRLDFKKQLPIPCQNESDFFMFVHKVFNQRRKLITSIFHNPTEKEKALLALNSLGFDEKMRGESMFADALAALYIKIYCEQK